jgi:hypothetical protein
MGFLNFYLSTGFCLWIMALLWRPTGKRLTLAMPLAVLAALAHPMPLLWAACMLGYVFVARKAPSWLRPALPLLSIAAMAALEWVLTRSHYFRFENSTGFPGLGITGADQTWLFGPKYLIISFGLISIWSLLVVKRIDQGGFWRDPLVQVWLLHLAAFLSSPSAIQFPQYLHPLAYIPQRASLFIGLLMCAIVAEVSARRVGALSAMLAVLYFVFVFTDSRAHNLVERRVSQLVAKLPPGQRVVAVLTEPGLLHVVDRACIGHCFSYGNYEPATKQFRLRALGPNPYVAASMAAVEIEEGTHVVTPEEAPIYSVSYSSSNPGDLCLRELAADDRICALSLQVSPELVGRLSRGNQRNCKLDKPPQRLQVRQPTPRLRAGKSPWWLGMIATPGLTVEENAVRTNASNPPASAATRESAASSDPPRPAQLRSASTGTPESMLVPAGTGGT